MIVSFKTKTADDWRFVAETSKTASEVWFHIFAGPATAGVFLTIEQARNIAHALTVAADEASIKLDRAALSQMLDDRKGVNAAPTRGIEP